MNTPNPLVPQGTFPDSRGRSHIRIAVFTILAVHLVLLSALLMAGCKKTAVEETTDKSSNSYPPVVLPSDTNPPSMATTSAPPPTITNPPATTSITTPVPPPEVTPAVAGTEHVVMKGDSFYTIGKKYGVTVKAITEANPGVESSRLKIGQKLKIPAASTASSSANASAHPASNGNGSATGAEQTYTVKSGDNLLKIAKAYSVSVKNLRSVNALKTDQIKVGQKLKIPAKSAPEISAGAPSASAAVTSTPAQ